jgi:hypothetical protein
MTTPAQEVPYCSDLSLQAGEALHGSAPQTEAYLLIEHNGAWGEKALEESDIPDAVKAHLKAYGKSNPLAKILLIRAPRPQQAPGVRFFVVSAIPQTETAYAFYLEDYSALLGLDIPAILAGDRRYAANRHTQPLLLVCTNGRRDLCCSRYGVPVLNTLAEALQDSPAPVVWHSSHVGGHRFAANLICLPHGLLYGRVGAQTAALILAAYQRGEVYLPNLRGRAGYPQPVQAAEIYLRECSGEMDLEAYRLLDAQQIAPGEWRVKFSPRDKASAVEVALRVEKGEQQVFESCTLDKRTAVTRYTLLD